MSLTDVLAWTGTLLGLVRTAPQTLVVYRTKNLNGLSVQSCLWLLVAALWWDLYALVLADLPLFASSLGATVAPILIWYQLTARNMVTRRDTGLLIGAGLSAVVLLPLGGVTAVGLLASGSTIVYAAPQLVKLVKTRDVAGVSLGTWVLTAVNTSIWAAYGLLTGLTPLVLPALVMLPTAMLVMTLHARQRVAARRTEPVDTTTADLVVLTPLMKAAAFADRVNTRHTW